MSQKITEKEVAQSLLDSAYVLITQPEADISGQKVESLRRIPLSVLLKKCGNGDVEVDPEVVKQIVDEYLAENPTSGVTDQEIADAVADYLKDNPVQAGATAEEAAQIAKNKSDIEILNHEKLNASKLPEAVNDALAQAKASGEFDGKDGNDYVLTEADKQEIADMVEVPSGGGGESSDIYYIATEDPDFPLVADAAADNTLAMQKLIEKVHNAGGGIIWLPIGEYGFDRNSKDRTKVTDDFRMCVQPMSNVSIMGESLTKTVIKVYGANSDTAWMANQVDKNSTDVALSGFTYQNFTVDMSASELAVDANGQFIYSSSAKAFGMKALKNCVFRDLRILESPATSFGIDMLDNVVIDSLYIYKGGKRWSYGNPGGAGIGIGTGRWEQENFIVRNCICAGCGHFGIFIEDQGLFSSPPVNKYTMGQIITNNVVRNGRHYGIGVRGGQNIVVTGNNIYSNKGGIYMDYGAKRVMVSNNAITENAEVGLLFGTEDAREGFNGFACENISVSGNSFIKNKLGLSVMREPIDSKIEDNAYIGNDADMPVEILIDESKIMQDVYIDNYGEYITLAGNVLYDEFIDLDTTMVTWTPIGETATGALHNPRIAIYAEDKSFIWRINGDYKPDELRSELEAALTAHGGRTDYRYIKFGDNCNGEIMSTLKLYDLTANTGNGGSNQPLTFTGAVNATYDGSQAVSVEIPVGGGSGEVWEYIGEFNVGDSDVEQWIITEDANGNPIELKKMYTAITLLPATATTGNTALLFGNPAYRNMFNTNIAIASVGAALRTSKNTHEGTFYYCPNGYGSEVIHRYSMASYNVTWSRGYERNATNHSKYCLAGLGMKTENASTGLIGAGSTIKIWGVRA